MQTVTPTDQATSVDTNRKIPVLKAISINSDNETNINLRDRLHRSLDIENILELFFIAMGKKLGCCGLNFQNDARELLIQYGTLGNECQYFLLYVPECTLGELCLSRHRPFRESHKALLATYTRHLVQPLANAFRFTDAVKQSLTDPLTGLWNRINLEAIVTQEMHHAIRHNHPLTVLMIDIDEFKVINDRFGHVKGDQVTCG